MRVYDASTSRRLGFIAQVNWSRPRAFSTRQRRWIRDAIPQAPGVYVILLDGAEYRYGRGRSSPIVYFGSGWLNQRLFRHLQEQANGTLERLLAVGEPLTLRWAEIEDEDDEDWPVVVEGLFIQEFKRRFGCLPPANRMHPPYRPMLSFSSIQQHPVDVLQDL
jgi:hypothetical protein